MQSGTVGDGVRLRRFLLCSESAAGVTGNPISMESRWAFLSHTRVV